MDCCHNTPQLVASFAAYKLPDVLAAYSGFAAAVGDQSLERCSLLENLSLFVIEAVHVPLF